MKQQKKYLAIILLICITAALVMGCAPNPSAVQKLDPAHAGVWDKYFVIPLSDLLDWFKTILGNYGWSILIVTFLVRLVIFPLSWKQQKSSLAMQKLQPKLLKLRKKHEKDPQKLQVETMKMFQDNNVNPLAGCFPIIVQLPILLAFYQAIMRNAHIAESSFLYMQLGQPDPFFILPALAAITTYIQLAITGVAENPQMKVMLFVMPIMIFVLAFGFPSALSLYWVYGNVFTIAQYMLIFKPMKDKDAVKA